MAGPTDLETRESITPEALTWEQRRIAAGISRRDFMRFGTLALLAACAGQAGSTTTQAGPAATTAPSATTAGPGASTTAGAPASDVIRYGRAGDITDFNPWDISANEQEVYNQVFSRLVWRDFEGNERLDLAESWEQSPDGMTVTIKVREGVKWHDGADFSAEDYVTMFGYLTDPALAEDPNVVEMSGVLSPIVGVEAPDPTTLVITSSVPIPYVVDLLDYWHAIRIDNPEDFGFVETPPVGTGPFRLTSVTPGQRVTFEANEDYYQDGQPRVGGFEINLFGGATNLIQNIQAGGVDGLLIANRAELEAISGDDSFYVVTIPTGTVTNFYVNVSKPPFDNPQVRQALSYSMNRPAMVTAANFEFERPVATPFYTPSSLAYREDLVLAHNFDLDRARSLLEEAGVAGLTINYPAPSNFPEAEIYGLIWQSDLAQIGVTMNIEAVDQGRWVEFGTAELPDETDVVFWFNGRGNRDPAIFWNTQRNYGGKAETIWGFNSDELMNLVGEAEIEVDPNARQQLYQQTNQFLYDSSHVLNLATRSQTWVWSAAVSDVDVDLIGALALGGAGLQR